MPTSMNFKNNNKLYDALMREIHIYYKKNNIEEPHREEGIIYLEEFGYVERLRLDYSGFCTTMINNKGIMSYLTNLKSLTIKSPFMLTNNILSDINNKDKLEELYIEGLDINKLDLKGFCNLKVLELKDNNNLEVIEGLDKISNLEDLEIYNNQKLDEEDICNFIIKNMENRCNIRIDILYYKRIIKKIRDNYDKYRDSFLNATWIERIYIGSEKNQIIEHNTESTGLFYAKLSEILDKIIPNGAFTNIELIYLTNLWINTNIKYDHDGLKNALKMRFKPVQLNLGDKVQNINMSVGHIGGTNGAFNALYYKLVVCEGFTKLFQMFIKALDYTIKTYDEVAYCDVRPDINRIKSLTEAIKNAAEINHSIIRIDIENNTYYIDTTNEKIDNNGNLVQSRFMRTYEELDSSWFPKTDRPSNKSVPLSDYERKELAQLKMANSEINYERKALLIIDRFNIHLDADSLDLANDKKMLNQYVKELMLLGFINEITMKIVYNYIDKEYLSLTSGMSKR